MSSPDLEMAVQALVEYHVSKHGGIAVLLIPEGYEAIVFDRGPLLQSLAESIELRCLNCNKRHRVAQDSEIGRGIFNPFCPNGDCEDLYAARL